MIIKTDGVVIREQTTGERDRLVTLLTRKLGVIRAFVNGVRSPKSRNSASTGLLCYSDFVIEQKKSGVYTVAEATAKEVFFSLREDIVSLSLAQYFCQAAAAFAICLYYSTKRNYRRGEEHGSAKWGNPKEINRKYMQQPSSDNKLLTQQVRVGLDGRKHRRNLNVLVCGGSGAGKTRFYCSCRTTRLSWSWIRRGRSFEIQEACWRPWDTKSGYWTS